VLIAKVSAISLYLEVVLKLARKLCVVKAELQHRVERFRGRRVRQRGREVIPAGAPRRRRLHGRGLEEIDKGGLVRAAQ